MKKKRVTSLFLALMMSFSVIAGDFAVTEPVTAEAASTASEIEAAAEEYKLQDDVQDGVTLQCWNWSYNNIKNNMETIAEQGFSAIQTSPIQTCKEATSGKTQGSSWWLYYQPAEFTIDNTGTNALGTKAEFEEMCETAHEYGIKVIVDVVANHLGNTTGNDLSSAIPSDIRNDASCWHDITTDISDYSSRYNITQYCMSGLPDLNTGSTKIQQYVLSYLEECIDAGADGFRFDAAKHIETPDDSASGCGSQFWPTVVNGAEDYAYSTRGIDLYCYGEVLDQPDTSGALSITSYTKYISVTDNQTGNSIRNAVNSGNASGAATSYYNKSAAGADKLVLWAESHDTYADNSSSGVSTDNINKTWALVAARADAMGLYFARPNSYNTLLGAADTTGWSYDVVAKANKFHNQFAGTTEYCASSGNIAYIERGTAGVVLVNCSGGSTSVNVTAHEIADGTYTDQVSGNTFVVSGGVISGNIGSTGVAIVYNVEEDGDDDEETDNVAYLKVPSGWSTPVYCYAYDSATETVNNGAWPGVEMTYVSDGVYKYEVPDKIKKPRVIFYSSDTNRYPADMEKGLLLSGSMIYEDGEWAAYEEEIEITGTVVAKYVDEDGNTLADSVTTTGVVGMAYITLAKTISGYTLVSTPENASGTYLEGSITVTYVYEKNEDETTENTAYIYKPGSWGSDLYCYVYSADDESNRNAVWPGEKMTQVSGSLYKYEVSSDITNPLVLFTDGSNQYPSSGQAGLSLSGSMIYKNGNWNVYSEDETIENTAYLNLPSGWGSDVYCYVYSADDESNRNAVWPGEKMTQVSGPLYKYEVSSDITNPLVLFTDGSNQYPSSGQAGLSLSGAMIYSNGSWTVYTE